MIYITIHLMWWKMNIPQPTMSVVAAKTMIQVLFEFKLIEVGVFVTEAMSYMDRDSQLQITG